MGLYSYLFLHIITVLKRPKAAKRAIYCLQKQEVHLCLVVNLAKVVPVGLTQVWKKVVTILVVLKMMMNVQTTQQLTSFVFICTGASCNKFTSTGNTGANMLHRQNDVMTYFMCFMEKEDGQHQLPRRLIMIHIEIHFLFLKMMYVFKF